MKDFRPFLSQLHLGKAALVAGCLGGTVGGLDVGVTCLSGPLGFIPAPYLLGGFAFTALLGAGLFLAIWILLAPYLLEGLKLQFRAASTAMALGVGAVLRTVAMTSLLGDLPSKEGLLKVGLSGAFGLVVATLVYRFSRLYWAEREATISRLLWRISLPLILTEAMVCLCAKGYHRGPFLQIPWFMAWIFPLLVAIYARLPQSFRDKASWIVFVNTLLLFWIATSRGLFPSGSNGTHSPRHVILIVVDTLRSDAVSCYGRGTTQTPHMDVLASDSTLFTRAVSPSPWTLPAMASILTGVSPSVHGTSRGQTSVPEGLRSLPEHLQDQGYLTAAIVGNHVLTDDRNWSQGFDQYHLYQKISPIGPYSMGPKILEKFFPEAIGDGRTSDLLTAAAAAWIERYRKQDFFLWLHYYDPHDPYAPPPEHLPGDTPPPGLKNWFEDFHEIRLGHWVPPPPHRDWIRGLYEGEVTHVDDCVGRFVETLKKQGIYDEALLILTSDHGEEFWDHGGVYHGHTLHDELLSVPLMVKVPSSRKEDYPVPTVNALLSTECIPATILDLCQVPFDASFFTSRTLLPFMVSEEASSLETPPVVSAGMMLFEERVSVTLPGWRYVYAMTSGTEVLYDLADDPGETTSVAGENPDIVEEARRILTDREARARQIRETHGITSQGDDAQRWSDQLKDLGYAGK